MTPTAALARGMLLGLGAAVPIGPVNVEIARRTLRYGFPAGLAIGCGAVTVDMSYALAVSAGLGDRLARSHALAVLLGLAGAAILTYLAVGSFRSARAAVIDRRASPLDLPAGPPTPDPSALVRTYATGLLMTATNPMTLAFWFVALPAIVGAGALRGELPLTCAGVGLGALGWCVAFASTLSLLGRFNRHAFAVVADVAGGLILLGFAVLAAYHALNPLA